MVDIVKAKFPHTPDIGDYMFGEEYLMAKPVKLLQKCNMVALTHFALNPFNALENMGVDTGTLLKFMRDVTYHSDPFAPHRAAFGVVPEVLLTQDVEVYDLKTVTYKEMLKDTDWNRKFSYEDYAKGDDVSRPQQWARALMGSGYTEGTLPSDGHGQIEYGYVGLSNGDALRCYVWEWYNK